MNIVERTISATRTVTETRSHFYLANLLLLFKTAMFAQIELYT